MNQSSPQQVIIAIAPKNVGVAVALGVLFGPLGLLYSSVKGGIVMFLVNGVVGLVTLGFGLLLTWPVCGVWAYVAAKKHNTQLFAAPANVTPMEKAA